MPSTTVRVVSALAGAACQATATQATASVTAVSFEKIFMLGSILPVRPRAGTAGREAVIAWVDPEATTARVRVASGAICIPDRRSLSYLSVAQLSSGHHLPCPAPALPSRRTRTRRIASLDPDGC